MDAVPYIQWKTDKEYNETYERMDRGRIEGGTEPVSTMDYTYVGIVAG